LSRENVSGSNTVNILIMSDIMELRDYFGWYRDLTRSEKILEGVWCGSSLIRFVGTWNGETHKCACVGNDRS